MSSYEEQAENYKSLSGKDFHTNTCATSCAPAREPGPCDCSEDLIKLAARDLYLALSELAALVRGECPSLLDEDCGGSALLDMQIDEALAKAEGRTA